MFLVAKIAIRLHFGYSFTLVMVLLNVTKTIGFTVFVEAYTLSHRADVNL